MPRNAVSPAVRRRPFMPNGSGRLPRVLPRAPSGMRLLRAQPVPAYSERLRPGDAGPGQDPRPDRDQPFRPVRARLDLVGRGAQGEAHEIAEVAASRRAASLALAPRPGRPRAGTRGHSCSRAVRRAVMPRAVWLLTAPRLIPIAVAISASDRSA